MRGCVGSEGKSFVNEEKGGEEIGVLICGK